MKFIFALTVLFSSAFAQADVYFCNFSHRSGADSKYSYKFSDIVFKNFEGVLHDDFGDLAVSIHYSYSRNLVTQVISDERIHAKFSDPANGTTINEKSIEQGKDLKVQTSNNWLIRCTSVINMPY